MLKYIGNIKTTALMLLLAAAFTACSSDVAEDPIGPSTGNKVKVNLTIGVQPAHNATRAATEEVGTDNENMFSWFVIAVKDNTVAAIWENTNLPGVKEDPITNVELETGTYDFYSFANIKQSDITSLKDLKKGDTMPNDLSTAIFSVKGNGFNINGNHIPMSNKETIMISGTESYELHVIRMLAKIELQLKNESSSDITIKSATLSDITTNTSNIKLLPKMKGNSDYICEPNLPANSITTEDYTYTPTTPIQVTTGNTESMTFYVNESATPENLHNLFTLTLETGTGVKRYALISNDENEWDYIARNDHRVIPVILQDYKLDIIPKDFPPIAVLPASVKEEDGLFTVTFHAPGHFHLEPVVTKYSTGETVNYGNDKNQWTFDSWTTVGTIPDNFYITGAAPTEDECENGGEPAWVEKNHFIIGNLNDDYTADYTPKKAYHNLTIKVKESATIERQLTYHLCIIKNLAY